MLNDSELMFFFYSQVRVTVPLHSCAQTAIDLRCFVLFAESYHKKSQYTFGQVLVSVMLSVQVVAAY